MVRSAQKEENKPYSPCCRYANELNRRYALANPDQRILSPDEQAGWERNYIKFDSCAAWRKPGFGQIQFAFKFAEQFVVDTAFIAKPNGCSPFDSEEFAR